MVGRSRPSDERRAFMIWVSGSPASLLGSVDYRWRDFNVVCRTLSWRYLHTGLQVCPTRTISRDLS